MRRDEILGKLRERIVAFVASRYQRDQAEDIAQDVMIVLEEKYAEVDRIEDLLPLSLQIARFKITSGRRKAVRHGEYSQVSVDDIPLPSAAPSQEAEAARREQLDRIAAAVNTLGERCRDIFRWKLEGLTFPEIQQRLHADSLNTVYTWDSRCRKQLLSALGGGWV
ncbi:MAG: sigma-70 family RNA polymerase sigma factor, partial [Bryobacteraceae bacterium]